MKLYFFLLLFALFYFISSQNYVFAQNNKDITVKIINTDDLSAIINNSDLPLLINVWATWCTPCREEFPDLVKIGRSYGDKVRVVGISVDDSDVLNSKVIPFIKNQKADFEIYLLKVVESEDFINLLNKKWSGAIPATFIYDKDGNQKEMLIGKQSYESFEEAIKKVIE
ncbi:MAG: TlpA family protein disulfide reductase [Ignavibacteriaceae bacterium]|jgi:thiol-disulfide isomerase/thioredoxin|nr:TlpA family protein disulfide reductase [Ignavibacteriaceae bacterium]MCW8994966.1 TlpA family protein disulfide reductase [Psychromonas sp.]MCW8824658.1 TlpA family protein disulfide reductase [Ignavibacteriaceae bacterium]MCW8961614.1 TlpA family protein disulfide reductase [Ignavibacteriaceae bacterium]MCW9095307.1 TlpA family protein disulfide reductase [Ignavibacteriaceae bacterium]